MKAILRSLFVVGSLFVISVSCIQAQSIALARDILLTSDWWVQSSETAGVDGQKISSGGVNTETWYTATVPSTVMGVLTANGLYADLLESDNYKKASRTPFDVSWWYSTRFNTPELGKGESVILHFDGITYRANVWLNGELIVSKDDMYGPFRRFSFDITGLLREHNRLAVELFRAREGEPNIGFVDWNPRPLDENMGIFREVRLHITGGVDMKDTWVRSVVDTETLKNAQLYIETTLLNLSDRRIKGKLIGTIENKSFSLPITLAAGERRTVSISPKEAAMLNVKNPRLWWSNGMGSPELYNLDLRFVADNVVSSEQNVTFGIRQIDTYLTQEGHKGFILNGEKVLIASAGWTDDIFLRDTPRTNEIQVQYVKDMNLNSIRFENVWGTSHNIYDLCDRYGLLAIVGWSCQWEWEAYFGAPDDEFGSIRSQHDMDLLAESFRDQVIWLRNHPSIFAWMVGSDKLPRPELEAKYLEIYPKIDDRPYLGAAKQLESELSGFTGMKMAGPYEYVGPNYWFEDRSYGGAFGFNTETGAGSQIPVEESLKKILPADKLWPVNNTWSYHCTPSPSAFNSMEVTTATMDGKYGRANNLKEYLDRAHLLSYESVRSMFEAFRVNKDNGATGVVQWMLNSAWPSMYWQLYDYYLIPTSGYYGVRKANEPLQLIYNYADNHIYAVNSTLGNADGLRATAKGYDTDSKLAFTKEESFSVAANSAVKLFEVDNSALNTILFLSLSDDKNRRVTDNSYLMASRYDRYEWAKTNWIGTPIAEYADYRSIAAMGSAELEVTVVQKSDSGMEIRVENLSDVVALFTHFLLKDSAGEVIYPLFWEDNYISLEPGEKRTVKCSFDSAKLNSSVYELKISGWNIRNSLIIIQ